MHLKYQVQGMSAFTEQEWHLLIMLFLLVDSRTLRGLGVCEVQPLG